MIAPSLDFDGDASCAADVGNGVAASPAGTGSPHRPTRTPSSPVGAAAFRVRRWNITSNVSAASAASPSAHALSVFSGGAQ